MTNPNNIVRIRARKGGRASVYEANAWCQQFSTGLFEGNGVTPNTVGDMNVLVGGSATKPDVVIAENPAGYKVALDIVGKEPIRLTAPSSNSRIASIVVYSDDLEIASDQTNTTGSPSSCGVIVVYGASSASPVAPDDSAIRSAITSDGATGSQAVYAVIANVNISSSTSVVSKSLIAPKLARSTHMISTENVDWTTYKSDETVVGTWIDGKTIYRKMLQFNVTQAANQRHAYFNTTDFTFIDNIVKVEGFFKNDNGTSYPYGTYHMNVDGSVASSFAVFYEKSSKKLTITSWCDFNRNSAPMILAIHYTRV